MKLTLIKSNGIPAPSTSGPLKTMILDNYYQNLNNPEFSALFTALCQVRKDGYGADYPPHYLPLDQCDYIATHFLFFSQTDHGTIPVGALRHITLSRLAVHQMALPLMSSLLESQAYRHQSALQGLLDQQKNTEKEIVYSSRFVIAKEYRKDKMLTDAIKKKVAAILYETCQTGAGAIAIGGGAIKFKAHLYYEKVGATALTLDGRALEPFVNTHTQEEVLLVKLEKMSPWARSCYEEENNLNYASAA